MQIGEKTGFENFLNQFVLVSALGRDTGSDGFISTLTLMHIEMYIECILKCILKLLTSFWVAHSVPLLLPKTDWQPSSSSYKLHDFLPVSESRLLWYSVVIKLHVQGIVCFYSCSTVVL